MKHLYYQPVPTEIKYDININEIIAENEKLKANRLMELGKLEDKYKDKIESLKSKIERLTFERDECEKRAVLYRKLYGKNVDDSFGI